MKIDINDVRKMAFAVMPEGMKDATFVFDDDEAVNDRIICAISEKLGSLGCLKLIHFGMAKNYDEAKKLIVAAEQRQISLYNAKELSKLKS